jgi:hypothetical protein
MAAQVVTKSGQSLTPRVWALIYAAKRAAGLAEESARVVQGSYHKGSLSAGTHNGGGAFDLSVRGLSHKQILDLVNELRKRNVAAWYRSPLYGWPESLGGAHIHGIVMDEPGLSYAAKRQVINYRDGLNGLASKRKDPHIRPAQHPFVMPGTVPVLRRGMRNGYVKKIQHALGVTPETGYFGELTLKAIKAFQRKRPWLWPADGVVGPKTYAAILKAAK